MRASLLVLVGRQKGRAIPLPETLFVIGRDPLCHLRPHSSLVSRRHCTIARWGHRILLRDMKSANGTFLNQKKVVAQVAIQHGDVLQVGDIAFTVQIDMEGFNVPPSKRDESVEWLMDSNDDSSVLDPTLSTGQFDVSFLNLDNEPVEEPVAAGSKGLSAGKYLKDYLSS